MPRDERDRRRQIEQASIASPLNDSNSALRDSDTSSNLDTTALVTSVAGMSARIELDGAQRQATIRGLLTELDTGYINPVAVGDRVIVSADGTGAWAIDTVLPRRTVLVRPDPFLAPRQQVIAANVDQLLVVSSWRDPDLWLELIDRYLIAAGISGIEPVICINKADMIADMIEYGTERKSEYEAAIAVYRDMGHTALFTSALTGQGVEELRGILAGKLTVLSGLSGTGKSSLMAAVHPGLDIRIGAVSDAHRQGRHTTTTSTLYRLDFGGYVADTPGIREFGLAGLTLGELPIYFPEIDALAANCRFSNCAHLEEPGCAVRKAEYDGLITPSRADSYRAVFDELDV